MLARFWESNQISDLINIFRKCVEKIRVSLNLSRITGTFHQDQCFLVTKKVSDKSYRGKTHIFVFSNFLIENGGLYEIMFKNVVEPDRTQMAIWFMRIACWITKATNFFYFILFYFFI